MQPYRRPARPAEAGDDGPSGADVETRSMATIQPAAPTADHALVREPKVREDASFAAEHPRSTAFRDRGLDLLPNGLPMAWLRGSYPASSGCGRSPAPTSARTHRADCPGSATPAGRPSATGSAGCCRPATRRTSTRPSAGRADARRPRATARPDRPAFGGRLGGSGRPRRRRERWPGRARGAAAAGRPRGVGR
jgi:hypothetical protein